MSTVKIRPFAKETIFSSYTVNLLNWCNLLCAYCSRDSNSHDHRRLSLEKVQNILRYFWLIRDGKVPLFVQFTGGEVFLHPNFFEILEFALSLGYFVRIQTNGTLLSRMGKAEEAILKNSKIIFKVSIDGWDEKTHGKYRGVSTFAEVVSGIEFLKRLGVRFGLKSVINESNFLELEKMLDFCLAVGAKGWSYNTLMQSGRSKEDCPISEMEVIKRLVPLYNQDCYKTLLNGNNVLTYYQFSRLGVDSWPPYLYFNFEGTVCVTDKIIPSRVLGKIKNGTKEEISKVLDGVPFVVYSLDRPIARDIMEFVSRNLIL